MGQKLALAELAGGEKQPFHIIYLDIIAHSFYITPCSNNS